MINKRVVAEAKLKTETAVSAGVRTRAFINRLCGWVLGLLGAWGITLAVMATFLKTAEWTHLPGHFSAYGDWAFKFGGVVSGFTLAVNGGVALKDMFEARHKRSGRL